MPNGKNIKPETEINKSSHLSDIISEEEHMSYTQEDVDTYSEYDHNIPILSDDEEYLMRKTESLLLQTFSRILYRDILICQTHL